MFVRGVPKVQPAEDTQTMTHARSTISLVVRVISRSKNNFYDVIRLKIIESRYFPKETVKVGLEKIKQIWLFYNWKRRNVGELSSAEITNLDVDIVIFLGKMQMFWFSAWFRGKNNIGLGRHWLNFGTQTMDRLGVIRGWRITCKLGRNKYLIK